MQVGSQQSKAYPGKGLCNCSLLFIICVSLIITCARGFEITLRIRYSLGAEIVLVQDSESPGQSPFCRMSMICVRFIFICTVEFLKVLNSRLFLLYNSDIPGKKIQSIVCLKFPENTLLQFDLKCPQRHVVSLSLKFCIIFTHCLSLSEVLSA